MTEVIVFAGLGNTQKSSLINGHEDEAGVADYLRYKGKTVKVYNEIARSCYHILEDKGTKMHTIYEFQKTIHELETERVKEIIEEKKKNLFDVILVDRTWLCNVMYANQNKIWGRMKKPEFFNEDPGSDILYDLVILLTDPVKDSSKEEFDIYSEERFKRRYNRLIRAWYDEHNKVKTFKNGITDWNEILDYVMNNVINKTNNNQKTRL